MNLITFFDYEIALLGQLFNVTDKLSGILHLKVLNDQSVRGALGDDFVSIGVTFFVRDNVPSVSNPLGYSIRLGDLDDELNSVLLDRFGVLETFGNFESRSHEELRAGGYNAALALDATTVNCRIALLNDELAFGVIHDHIVLLRVVLRNDLLSLKVPVAFGVTILNLALDFS